MAAWILAANAADGSTSILVSGGRYRARVENYDPGFSSGLGWLDSAFTKLAFNGSAIGLGGTAAKILYVERHVLILTRAEKKVQSGCATYQPHLHQIFKDMKKGTTEAVPKVSRYSFN